jgi:hypothetical protein
MICTGQRCRPNGLVNPLPGATTAASDQIWAVRLVPAGLSVEGESSWKSHEQLHAEASRSLFPNTVYRTLL